MKIAIEASFFAKGYMYIYSSQGVISVSLISFTFVSKRVQRYFNFELCAYGYIR